MSVIFVFLVEIGASRCLKARNVQSIKTLEEDMEQHDEFSHILDNLEVQLLIISNHGIEYANDKFLISFQSSITRYYTYLWRNIESFKTKVRKL